VDLEALLGQKLLLAFQGKESLPEEFVRAMYAYRPGGITLFRSLNIDNPSQVRNLTENYSNKLKRLDCLRC